MPDHPHVYNLQEKIDAHVKTAFYSSSNSSQSHSVFRIIHKCLFLLQLIFFVYCFQNIGCLLADFITYSLITISKIKISIIYIIECSFKTCFHLFFTYWLHEKLKWANRKRVSHMIFMACNINNQNILSYFLILFATEIPSSFGISISR